MVDCFQEFLRVSPQISSTHPLSEWSRSVQFRSSIRSNSLKPHGPQHARPSCPSPTPGVYSNSCPLCQWCHPTILSSVVPLLLPSSIFPSIRVFSNESALRIRWPKYWHFSFGISPSTEYSGLISFRTDWLDLLAVQGTLKSLPQHHSSKALILRRSAFFIVQLSHPYMTTGKPMALTRWTFVGKITSLLFNMQSRLVITFLPRSKHLLISSLQSPSTVILEPPQNKVCHCFYSFSIYLPWSDGTGLPWSFVFWMLSFKPTSSLSSFTFIKRLFHQEELKFFTFCYKGGIICISEITNISPGNLDSILCFIQPSVSHDAFCM